MAHIHCKLLDDFLAERLDYSCQSKLISEVHQRASWKTVMHAGKLLAETVVPALPSLRFEVSEAAQILRMSRAQLYNRIHDGSLKPQKDGARTYITRVELERYVQACGV